MKIRFIQYTTVLVICFLTLSCSETISFLENSQLADLNSKVNEYVQSNDKVEDITLLGTTTTSVGFDIEALSINYLNEANERRKVYVPLSGSSEARDDVNRVNSVDILLKTKEGNKLQKGRSISKYDFTIIKTNIDDAIAQAKEAGYTVEGINSYTIVFYDDASFDRHSFSLLSKVEDSTRLQGRRIVTEYYELTCSVSEDGSVKVEGLDKK